MIDRFLRPIGEKRVPLNLEDCFEILETFGGLDVFKSTDEDSVIGRYHSNIGMHLRNLWKLWEKSALKDYFEKMGIFHPDDMSGIILLSFHRHLNSKPIELEKQIEFYKEYWKKGDENV